MAGIELLPGCLADSETEPTRHLPEPMSSQLKHVFVGSALEAVLARGELSNAGADVIPVVESSMRFLTAHSNSSSVPGT